MDLRRFALATFIVAVPALAVGAPAQRRISKQEIRAVTASSTSQAKLNGRAAFRTKHLVDGVNWTPWGEGVAGDGKGQSIRLTFGGTHYVTKLLFLNGNGRDMKAWKSHGRVKDLTLKFRNGQKAIKLKNTPAPQEIALDAITATDFLELIVDSTYGATSGPLSLSEVGVYEPVDILGLRPDLRETIEQGLADLGDPAKGAAAAKVVGAVGAPAVPALAALIGDPNLGVRTRVATALGATGAPQAAPILQKLYERSAEREVKRTVLAAMRNLHSQDAIGFLGRIAGGDDAELARLAVLAMEGIGGAAAMKVLLHSVIHGEELIAATAIRHLVGFGEEAVGGLKPHLRDPRIHIRARAVWALGRAGGADVQDQLIRFINTGDLPIVLAGLRGLGETGAPEAFDTLAANRSHELVEVRLVVVKSMTNFHTIDSAEVLSEVIRTDADPAVVAAAWSTLGRLGPKALPIYVAFVDGDNAEHRRRALDIVAKKPGPGALGILLDRIAHKDKSLRDAVLKIIEERKDGGEQAIIEALSHEDSGVRFAATRLLVSKGPRAVKVLADSALNSDDPATRVASLRCLAEIRDRRGAAAVIAGLKSPNRRVRRAAVRAASRIPSDGYDDILVKLLDDEDDDVRLGAVEALGATRTKVAVPVLIARLEAGDRNSIRILWALGEIGDPRALPVLAKQIKSREAFTRQMVVEALGKIGGDDATSLLFDAMVDSDASVRKKAESALAR